jgi:hypothetical protein
VRAEAHRCKPGIGPVCSSRSATKRSWPKLLHAQFTEREPVCKSGGSSNRTKARPECSRRRRPARTEAEIPSCEVVRFSLQVGSEMGQAGIFTSRVDQHSVSFAKHL